MLLYLMHVDWRWIKQRPHFLAELLADELDLVVAHPVHRDRASLPTNDSRVSRRPLLRTIALRYRGLPWLDAALQRVWIGRIARREGATGIWLTHPSLLDYVPERLRGLPLIYDCMDDALGFSIPRAEKRRVLAAERALVGRAALVLASSERLRRVLLSRHPMPGLEAKMHVVRNGMPASLLEQTDVSGGTTQPIQASPGECRLAYVGTVASWFDHDSVHRALDAVPGAMLEIFGPLEGAPVPHPRVAYRGVVEHSEIPKLLRRFDLLVMPFVPTELIQAVDPVKLYEYLSSGREVAAVWYPEIDRFAPYVHFYRSADELAELVRAAANGTLPRRNRANATRTFLAESTWQQRARQVRELLHTIPLEDRDAHRA